MRNGLRKARMLGMMLALFCLASSAFAQTVIKGRVTDGSNNQTLPGVSVAIKGTTQGTITDMNGNYSIAIKSASDILVFSYIGYTAKEIPVGAQTSIDVALTLNAVNLDELVVMGYSSKKRTEITSAVTTISSDKLMDVTSNDIGTMLQGKVSGIQVINSSGAPGSGSEIRIRGISSMSAPQGPLYVVDGIIGGTFDPNDVETITVLKDAGATGMYGSQANGE